MAHLVYFSSVSENTHRFVRSWRGQAKREERTLSRHPDPLRGDIEVDTPYVLIVPTYGGGHPVPGKAGDTSPNRSSNSSTTKTTDP